ncbi:MAG: YSC84-related protein [Chthoniobacterales bacterium]
MKHLMHTRPLGILFVAMGVGFSSVSPARADSAAEVRRDSRAALQQLYATTPAARGLRDSATAVLVFPRVVKAGFLVGGQHGDGTLFSGDKTLGYYKTVAASYGLQAGIQKFGYALFFMNQSDLDYLRKSNGWEIGTGPSVVIVDKGMARSFTSTTIKKGVYAFAFGQKGLMAGFGLQGTKITKINPK